MITYKSFDNMFIRIKISVRYLNGFEDFFDFFLIFWHWLRRWQPSPVFLLSITSWRSSQKNWGSSSTEREREENRENWFFGVLMCGKNWWIFLSLPHRKQQKIWRNMNSILIPVPILISLPKSMVLPISVCILILSFFYTE